MFSAGAGKSTAMLFEGRMPASLSAEASVSSFGGGIMSDD